MSFLRFGSCALGVLGACGEGLGDFDWFFRCEGFIVFVYWLSVLFGWT